jgi:outer membrane protein assembly factor BamB
MQSLLVKLLLATAVLASSCAGSQAALQTRLFTSDLLPSPSRFSAQPHSSSAAVSEIVIPGSDFDTTVYGRLSASGTNGLFAPNWTTRLCRLEDTAYGVYHLDLSNYSGKPTLLFDWSAGPQETGKIWIGLSDWARDTWEWRHPPEIAPLEFPGLQLMKYINGVTGEMLVAVVITGTDPAKLCSIRLGSGAGDWCRFGHDLHNTRRSPFAGPATGNLAWTFDTGSSIFSSPVLDQDGTAYFGAYDGKIYAVNELGHLKWTFATGAAVICSPALAADGTVYCGSDDHNLYAINPDGTRKWIMDRNANLIEGAISVGRDGTIYYGDYTLFFNALYPDCSQKWCVGLNQCYESCAAIADNGTLFLSGWGSKLLALNPDDGANLWEFQAADMLRSSPVISDDGTTIYIGCYDNQLLAVNAVDGKLKWAFSGATNDFYATAALAADGTIIIGSTDGNLYAVNPDSTLKWKYTTSGPIVSSAIVDANGAIYFGSQNQVFYALDADGNLLWFYKTGGQVRCSPALSDDGYIYIGNDDGKLYCFGS